MFLDLIFFMLLLTGIIKGYRKGLIIALFSIISFIAGIAAALKFSAVASEKLAVQLPSLGKWLPFFSFMLVFIVVIIAINIGTKMLQTVVETLMLGWLNRIGGIVFYVMIYCILFSVFLFYGTQMHLINQSYIENSQSYSKLYPLAPMIIDGIGEVIPLFKGAFSQLQNFFQKQAL
ncbi:MAG: CvpA family protein [Ferruginibacter sp.]